jgi:hypothetical protein
MAELTITIPDELEAQLLERFKGLTPEMLKDYLMGLLVADLARSGLENVLLERLQGPFTPFGPDWKEEVRRRANEQLSL